jgi:twitching motility protein PilT
MTGTYEITRVLEEIIEDEKVGASKHKKVSQQEIRQLLREKRKAPDKPRDTASLPLGKAMVQGGLITEEQLETALKVQAEKKGKIGSILVELGYISDEHLLRFLATQLDVETANLLNISIGNSVMSLIPSRIMLKYRVLPIRDEEHTISLAMEDPGNHTAIREVEFLTGKRVSPFIAPSYQMESALKHIEEKGAAFLSGTEIRSGIRGSSLPVEDLLGRFVLSNGSDLFITAGASPTFKRALALARTDLPPVNADQCAAYARALMTEGQWERFLKEKEINFATAFEGIRGRFRVDAYRQQNTVSLAIRHIRDSVPSFEELGLPELLDHFIHRRQGFMLVASPSGHGKTTTMASIIESINKNRRVNILTLEDPIEYVFKPGESNVSQREIGADTDSFPEGMRRIFKLAPEVIAIGEMEDPETIEIALKAAATGHLVLASIHAGTTTGAIEALVDHFPRGSRETILQRIAEALLVVFSQRLIPREENVTGVLAYEMLVNSPRIKGLLRDGRIQQIRASDETGSDDFIPMDESIQRHLREGRISLEDALACAENPDILLNMIST